MPSGWTNSVSTSTSQVYGFVLRQPSWVVRAALTVAMFVLVAVVVLLIVPAIVIGIAAFILFALIARVRRWLSGMRSPNGSLDGRRNVRVIVRQ